MESPDLGWECSLLWSTDYIHICININNNLINFIIKSLSAQLWPYAVLPHLICWKTAVLDLSDTSAINPSLSSKGSWPWERRPPCFYWRINIWCGRSICEASLIHWSITMLNFLPLVCYQVGLSQVNYWRIDSSRFHWWGSWSSLLVKGKIISWHPSYQLTN